MKHQGTSVSHQQATHTLCVEKLDVTCYKLDGPIGNTHPLLHDKNSIYHVDKAIFEGTFPNKFDAIALANCLCLGCSIEVDLVEGNKVLLVVGGRVLSLFECLGYSRSECFQCCYPGRHYRSRLRVSSRRPRPVNLDHVPDDTCRAHVYVVLALSPHTACHPTTPMSGPLGIKSFHAVPEKTIFLADHIPIEALSMLRVCVLICVRSPPAEGAPAWKRKPV